MRELSGGGYQKLSKGGVTQSAKQEEEAKGI